MTQRPSRPVGITILAVLEVLIGIVGLLASLLIIGFSALFATLPTVGPLLGAIGLVIGGVVLFFSIIWLATGVGFLHGRGWSWTLGRFSAYSHCSGHWRADNRSDHRWGRRIGLLGSDAVLSDEDPCESLLRKGRITNHSWLCNAIFTSLTDQQPANSSK